jgi:ABC-2 type transport system ATP-binding protein
LRIEWHHVRKVFGQKAQFSRMRMTGLIDFSASVREGVTALLGPAGSGKTTLLKLTALKMVPDDGRIVFFSHTKQPHVWSKGKMLHSGLSDLSFLKSLIHYTPHVQRLNQDITIESSLFMHAQLMRVPNPRKNIAEIIAKWGLAGYRKVPLYELSGAVLKRFLLARSLIAPAPIWIMDEPTEGLDPWGRYLLMHELKKRQRGQITLFATTTDMDLAECANDLMLLESGACRRLGSRKILTSGVPEGTVRAWYEAMQAFSYLRKEHHF